MATVIGRSGAWGSLTREVGRMGYTITCPDDIALVAVQFGESRQTALDARQAESAQSVRELSAQIAQLHDDRGPIVRFLHRHKVGALRYRVAALDAADRRFVAELDRVLHRIRTLPDSAEMAGARAELEVIEHLRLLPEAFVVFNDVRLEVAKAVHFDGAWLKSAQVDHVVIGPTGVFTVETKCWSRSTADSGHHHNPFDQADRAGHLCYVLLQRAIGDTRVRSVIASMGSLPAPPPHTMVKVVRPANLRTFIGEYAYGRQELDAEQIERLRRFFEGRVADRSAMLDLGTC